MAYRPVIPAGGAVGWSFLKRTLEDQKRSFATTQLQRRDTEYFREKIGSIKSAKDLVADRTLLKVALGAFGLDADIAKRAFIRKVLEDGTSSDRSLANRLPDKRYAALAESFGFDAAEGPKTSQPGFAAGILSAYQTQQFEAAVGEVDRNMRLALSLDANLQTVVESGTRSNTHWYAVMGTTALRDVFETAFGLPSGFGAIDVDRQMTMLRTKAKTYLGVSEVAEIAKPENVEKLRSLFLARAEASSGSYVARSSAATLLQGGGSASGLLSILYSG